MGAWATCEETRTEAMTRAVVKNIFSRLVFRFISSIYVPFQDSQTENGKSLFNLEDKQKLSSFVV